MFLLLMTIVIGINLAPSYAEDKTKTVTSYTSAMVSIHYQAGGSNHSVMEDLEARYASGATVTSVRASLTLPPSPLSVDACQNNFSTTTQTVNRIVYLHLNLISFSILLFTF